MYTNNMITLNEYINEGLQRQVVRNSIVNRISSSSNSKSLNNNDDNKHTTWKSLGLSATKFLTFIGGMTLGITTTSTSVLAVGIIVAIFAMLWGDVKNPYKESLDNNEDEVINEGAQDMIKGLLNKILEIKCVKRVIENISKLDGYAEIEKNKDMKSLVNLVKIYCKNNKEEIKEMKKVLSETTI